MMSNRSIKVSNREESRALVIEALDNAEGAARDIVALNAGLAIYAGNKAGSIPEALALAFEMIATGAARAKLEEFCAYTRKFQNERHFSRRSSPSRPRKSQPHARCAAKPKSCARRRPAGRARLRAIHRRQDLARQARRDRRNQEGLAVQGRAARNIQPGRDRRLVCRTARLPVGADRRAVLPGLARPAPGPRGLLPAGAAQGLRDRPLPDHLGPRHGRRLRAADRGRAQPRPAARDGNAGDGTGHGRAGGSARRQGTKSRLR